MKVVADKISANKKPVETLDRRFRLSSLMRRWIVLFFCMFLVWVFMFVVAPTLQKSPSIKAIAEFVEESGIDAGALYYTEVEEVGDAETNLKNTMRFPPRKQ